MNQNQTNPLLELSPLTEKVKKNLDLNKSDSSIDTSSKDNSSMLEESNTIEIYNRIRKSLYINEEKEKEQVEEKDFWSKLYSKFVGKNSELNRISLGEVRFRIDFALNTNQKGEKREKETERRRKIRQGEENKKVIPSVIKNLINFYEHEKTIKDNPDERISYKDFLLRKKKMKGTLNMNNIFKGKSLMRKENLNFHRQNTQMPIQNQNKYSIHLDKGKKSNILFRNESFNDNKSMKSIKSIKSAKSRRSRKSKKRTITTEVPSETMKIELMPIENNQKPNNSNAISEITNLFEELKMKEKLKVKYENEKNKEKGYKKDTLYKNQRKINSIIQSKIEKLKLKLNSKSNTNQSYDNSIGSSEFTNSNTITNTNYYKYSKDLHIKDSQSIKIQDNYKVEDSLTMNTLSEKEDRKKIKVKSTLLRRSITHNSTTNEYSENRSSRDIHKRHFSEMRLSSFMKNTNTINLINPFSVKQKRADFFKGLLELTPDQIEKLISSIQTLPLSIFQDKDLNYLNKNQKRLLIDTKFHQFISASTSTIHTKVMNNKQNIDYNSFLSNDFKRIKTEISETSPKRNKKSKFTNAFSSKISSLMNLYSLSNHDFEYNFNSIECLKGDVKAYQREMVIWNGKSHIKNRKYVHLINNDELKSEINNFNMTFKKVNANLNMFSNEIKAKGNKIDSLISKIRGLKM